MEKIEALRNLPFPLTEDNTDELKMRVKLHELGKAVGYTTDDDDEHGTVFHCGGSFLYTCAHVVENGGCFRRTSVTFEWIDLDSKETVPPYKYPPPQCDHTPPCKYDHRFCIFTNITDDEGQIDEAKIDLAIFREDRIGALKLPSIRFKSIVDMTFHVTSVGEITPHEVPESETFAEHFWREKNEKTFEHTKLEKDITSKDVTSSSGDTLYQIYWDFGSDTPTKRFCVTKQTESKLIASCFKFDSPAPEGASGSPVMRYRKVHDPEEEFCLVGVMSAGWEKVQLAELPESIKQHSNVMMLIKILHGRLVQYEQLTEHFRTRDNPNDNHFKKQIREMKKEIQVEISENLHKNGVERIFLGSLHEIHSEEFS